jgi:hypothetical protein
VTEDILLYVILGWKTVQRAGVDIVFDPDLITDLPEDTLTDILELSGGANPEEPKKKKKRDLELSGGANPEMSEEEEPEKN